MNNRFKLKLSLTLFALLILVVILSLSGFVWNVYNVIYFIGVGGFKIATYSLLVLLTGILSVFAVSALLNCKYSVENKTICLHFGVFKIKTALNDVTEITHFKKSDKLVIYFSDEKFSVIMIDKKDYDAFILAVRAQNPSIAYDVRIEGEDLPF